MSNFLKNLITFGAYGRIKNKEEELKREIDNLKSLQTSLQLDIEETNTTLNKLISAKMKAVNSLKLINKITKNIQIKDRNITYEKINKNVPNKLHYHKIKATIHNFDIVVNLSKGVSTGVNTALGAWAIAGYIGTASTGTAISSLSGIAATNATLAWLGGGSLAAGGGGMAAGTLVLGGLVAVPALVITGILDHVAANKKIIEIEKEELKIIKYEEEIKKQQLFYSLIRERTEELTVSINKSSEIFRQELKKTKKKLYPYPIISRIIKWARAKRGHNYFSNKDIEHINYIFNLGSSLAKLIDTQILDENGKLL